VQELVVQNPFVHMPLSQTRPHTPQLLGSVSKLKHWEPHIICGAGQAGDGVAEAEEDGKVLEGVMAVDDTVELSEKVPSDDDGDGVDEMMIGEGAIELAETDSATEEDGAMDDKITDDTAVEGSTMLELGAGVETKLALAELDENTADELIADEAAEVDKTGKALLEDTG
jgi:hypothetical protein